MLIATIFFMLFSSILFAQDSNRYTDSLFNYQQIIADGVYASAPEVNNPYQGQSLTHTEDLKFHLFTPENDSLKLRPLLICIHGGGFVSGNKEHDDMMEFCRLFTKKGYVTATIQYRLGLSFASSVSSTRAVYRGVQDGRAAVRFFKENADLYGIDTNNVYLLGSSAGAFVSLHNLFMNEESERPPETYEISNSFPASNNGPDLGSLDTINSTLKHGSHPQGVISLWGAIQSPDLIKASDGNIPLFLVHGTVDSTVPFDVGHPFGLPTLPETYGSKPINERLISLGFNYDTYFVSDANHEFYGVSNGMWSPAPNAYWDTVVTKSTNFLWNIHKPDAKFVYHEVDGYGSIQFTDSSLGAKKWDWDFGDGTTSQEQNPIHIFPDWGEYLVSLHIKNSINSWDTTSTIFLSRETSVDDKNNLPTKFELLQNYPNPFNPSTKITYQVTNAGLVTIKVFDVLGKEVVTLIDSEQQAGTHTIILDGANLSSGIYFYTMRAGDFVDTKKLVLMK